MVETISVAFDLSVDLRSSEGWRLFTEDGLYLDGPLNDSLHPDIPCPPALRFFKRSQDHGFI